MQTDRSGGTSSALGIPKDIDGYTLDKKISDYITRLALTCMGEDYAYQYRKKIEKAQTLRKAKQQKKLADTSNNMATDKSVNEDSFNLGRQ